MSRGSPKSLLRLYLLLGVVAVAGVGALAYSVVSQRRAAARSAPVTLDLAALEQLPVVSLGRADAPVTIVEFADFQCPGCSVFALQQLPRVKEELVGSGLARYVLVDFPLPRHENAVLAARAARCAGEQDRFWDYHDHLYASQPQWARQEDPTGDFVAGARGLQIDGNRFERCLRSDRYTAEVEAGREFGRSLRVRATPSVFVNGEYLPGLPSFEELERRVLAAGSGG